MGIKIVAAMVLGGLIGIDRERKMKDAGVKTNILICLGATLYTAVSHLLMDGVHNVVDPNRTSAQIVSGIGFLGAGAIIQGKGGVKGLTTAATIWVVAAIGVTIGCGYPLIATLFTITILVVLNLLGPFYKILKLKETYHLEVLSKTSVKDYVLNICQKEADEVIKVYEEIYSDDTGKTHLHVYMDINPKKIIDVTNRIKGLLQIHAVKYRMIDHDNWHHHEQKL